MTRCVPGPSPADRVRTACVRAPATVVVTPGAAALTASVHLLRAAPGTTPEVLVLAPADHPLAGLARRGGGVPAAAEVTDVVAVPLRQPVRGLAWLRGVVDEVDPARARSLALLVAAERPDDALLDLGHGATLLRLVVESAVLADASGAAAVTADELAAARPDPFAASEDAWLAHLDAAHGDVLAHLARHLPPRLHRGTLRPLGLDRHGLRLRVEQDAGDTDVRLPFPRPVEDAAALSAALRALVGCPFRRGLLRRAG